MPDTISIWLFILAIGLAATVGGSLAWLFNGVARRPLVLVCAVAVPVLLAVSLIEEPVPAAFAGWSLILIAGLTCLTVIDAQTRTVPDLVAIPMIALGLIHAATLDGFFTSFAIASFGIIGLGMLVGLLMKNRSGWIGGGDVLLFAGALAWLGPAVAPDIMLLTGVGLVILFSGRYLMHIAGLKNDQNPEDFMPLAPALGLAQMAVWLGGPLF